jgi:hypothetical protein
MDVRTKIIIPFNTLLHLILILWFIIFYIPISLNHNLQRNQHSPPSIIHQTQDFSESIFVPIKTNLQARMSSPIDFIYSIPDSLAHGQLTLSEDRNSVFSIPTLSYRLLFTQTTTSYL